MVCVALFKLNPLDNKCLTDNIIYKAKIQSSLTNYSPKTYIGASETKFKQRYANHKKSFNHERYKNETELSVEFWKLKNLNANPTVKFEIYKKTSKINITSKICQLCTNEKLSIIENKNPHLLNSRNELVSKCRHTNKFKLSNFKT